ncbi:MAG: NAD(P)-binding protein [Cyanobacteriota bacterium]|nr:NAD(P)-binding protein [Cyanobacteriota bacterium]
MVGAGVGGCTLAALLVRGGVPPDAISLWEAGRGPGGRTATRRSRADPTLVIDHGAPLFNLLAEPDPLLLPDLMRGGWVVPWRESIATINGARELAPPGDDPLLAGPCFRGQGGMEHLCQGLLAQAGEGLRANYDTLVRHVDRQRDRWLLTNAAGELLTEAEQLVLTGTLLAHPRSRLTFGWPVPPLRVLAERLRDPGLNHALAAIAALRFEARSTLLLRLGVAEDGPWRELPFQLLAFDPSAQQRWGLWRLSHQPLPDGQGVVVVHSSATFAAEHLGVYGSRSAMARQLGLAPSPDQERQVIQALADSLDDVMAPWLPERPSERGERQLMRWGAAFPLPPGLPRELGWNEELQLGFCGDFMEGAGFGRVEGAMRSAEGLATRLLGAPP